MADRLVRSETREMSPLEQRHVMTSESAVRLLTALQDRAVDACVGGGWAVDALLGEQTREHSDLDLWVEATKVESLLVALAGAGVDRVFPWPGDRPWNFVLHDGGELRIDLHLYEQLDNGTWHYGSVVTGDRVPDEALQGRGTIAGTPVRCDHPTWSVQWHGGYPLRAVDRHDVPRLCERFGIELPEPYRT
jgi:lincosamide nucleotidyltransferase A/C/D/E